MSSRAALRTESMAQARHCARAGLAQTLLNGRCLGRAHQTWPISPSIPQHDNGGPHLNCCHLIRHPASFISPLMPPPPLYPILDRGVGACASSPYSCETSSDIDSRSGYCTSTRTFHIMCAHCFHRRRTFHSSSRPPSCSSSPTYCPRLWWQPRADRRSSTRVRCESVILLSPCVPSRRI